MAKARLDEGATDQMVGAMGDDRLKQGRGGVVRLLLDRQIGGFAKWVGIKGRGHRGSPVPADPDAISTRRRMARLSNR